MRILIIEDYAPLRRSLAKGLKEAGYAVDVTGDGDEGRWFLEEFEFDILVLDLMLPGMDGLSILQWLRKAKRPTRVLILTAKDTVDDKVTGLDLGADDYLVKPFAFKELLARIGALARRFNGLDDPVIHLDPLEINTRDRTVTISGITLELTPKEYALLQLLALRQGRVQSREQIWNQLYDSNAENNSNVIDVFVRSLRKKLANAGSPLLIKTRRGYGYLIERQQ